MNWKWLFIHIPDLGIALVNELRFPANVPVLSKFHSGRHDELFLHSPQAG